MKNILVTLLSLILLVSVSSAQEISLPGKIWVEGEYLYVNIIDDGILIFNNSDPSSPQQESWIPIPNCRELAVVKGILYANHYDDLVSLDMAEFIKNGTCEVISRIEGVFPERINTEKDRLPICRPATHVGIASAKGGSMSRIAFDNMDNPNFLYVINEQEIQVYNVNNEGSMESVGSSIPVEDVVETIFVQDGNLFLGAQSGMYIYSLDDPRRPQFTGRYTHLTSCDPVVVQDNLAYVTVRDGNNCGQTVNQLHVVNIENLSSPSLVRSYEMTNPHGLAVADDKVFICDGMAGLRVFQTDSPDSLRPISVDSDMGKAYDVILNPENRHLVVVADNKVIQYNYSNTLGRLNKLSEVIIEL